MNGREMLAEANARISVLEQQNEALRARLIVVEAKIGNVELQIAEVKRLAVVPEVLGA